MEGNVCSSEADRVTALLEILNSSTGSTDMIAKLRAVDPNWAETLKNKRGVSKKKPCQGSIVADPKKTTEEPVNPTKTVPKQPKIISTVPVGGKQVRFTGGTITRLSKSIDDDRLVESLKNLNCSDYEDCLDKAIDFGWPGFSCANCENF